MSLKNLISLSLCVSVLASCSNGNSTASAEVQSTEAAALSEAAGTAEKILSIVCVGSGKTSEEHQQLMEEDFAKNPSYWESIPAIANVDIIYLPSIYISSPGILITDTINELADILETHLPA